MSTIVGVFESLGQAQGAIAELSELGLPKESIGVVTLPAGKNHLEKDSIIGAEIGAAGGLLAALAAVTVPGVGPVLVAGPILAALGGASVGALAGGLIGALTKAGLPQEQAHRYAESVGRGGVVVTVEASGEAAGRARRILGEKVAGHDPGIEPMSEDEIRRERENYARKANPANEWEHMNEKERSHAGHNPGHEDDEDKSWPHDEAHDIGESLVDSAAAPAVPKRDVRESQQFATGRECAPRPSELLREAFSRRR